MSFVLSSYNLIKNLTSVITSHKKSRPSHRVGQLNLVNRTIAVKDNKYLIDSDGQLDWKRKYLIFSFIKTIRGMFIWNQFIMGCFLPHFLPLSVSPDFPFRLNAAIYKRSGDFSLSKWVNRLGYLSDKKVYLISIFRITRINALSHRTYDIFKAWNARKFLILFVGINYKLLLFLFISQRSKGQRILYYILYIVQWANKVWKKSQKLLYFIFEKNPQIRHYYFKIYRILSVFDIIAEQFTI